MKYIMQFLIFLLITAHGHAQYGKGGPEAGSWENKTLVVVQYPDAPTYNVAVKSVVEERWYNNKIEYLSWEDIKTIVNKRLDVIILTILAPPDISGRPVPWRPRIVLTANSEVSTIYQWTNHDKGFAFQYIQANYNYARNKDYLKEKKQRCKADKSSTACSSVYGYALDVMEGSTEARIKLLVGQLFDTVAKFKEENYAFNPPASLKSAYGEYNQPEYIKKLEQKTLLIVEESIPEFKKEGVDNRHDLVKKYYQGKFKIVDEKTLGEAIAQKDPNALFLQNTNFTPVYEWVIYDIEDEKVIFCGDDTFNNDYQANQSKNKIENDFVCVNQNPVLCMFRRLSNLLD